MTTTALGVFVRVIPVAFLMGVSGACFAQCECPEPCSLAVNGDIELRLPFRAGEEYRVTQGYCGSSHTGYPVDFCMPEGTAVLAAADGFVAAIHEHPDNCWPDPCDPDISHPDNGGTWVRLRHVGPTETWYSSYLHLSQVSPTLALDAPISAGELLGYSGNSGWSSSAHLHLHVRDGDGNGARPVPMTDDGIDTDFVVDHSYRAQGPPLFAVGQSVEVSIGPLNVRADLCGGVLGAVQAGTVGTVIAGPERCDLQSSCLQAISFQMWKIQWPGGLVGWSAQNWLRAADAVPPSWAQRQVVGPPPRYFHAMAYDSARAATVLFGGIADGNYGGETWEWNGASWSQRAVSGPSPRWGHAMAYDSVRGVVVLCGGVTNAGANGETWEWDGTNWVPFVQGPSPRYRHAMVYDDARHVTVLFGGNTSDGLSGETWEWDGAAWTQRAVSGPSPRYFHAMTFDSGRAVATLHGGIVSSAISSETWEWNGISWAQRSVVGLPSRYGHSMSYHAALAATLAFGGYTAIGPDPVAETWKWDGTTWTQQNVIGPSARGSHAMAYDSRRAVTVLFGGSGGSGETWEFGSFTAPSEWTVVNLHPAGATESNAWSVHSGQQVGYAIVGGVARASLWRGDSASWVDLNPPGVSDSYAYGVSNGRQVGRVGLNNGLTYHASLWSGTAASWVDLNPAGASSSEAHGISGGQQVGNAAFYEAGGNYPRASLWTGSADSWVDLHQGLHSDALGTDGSNQVGFSHYDSLALLWSGSAASVVQLRAPSTGTYAHGVFGGKQVGSAFFGFGTTGFYHASLWGGTSASWLDLNPNGATSSYAFAVHGGQQVGYAAFGGRERASLWTGTAASYVDLHSFLPSEFTQSIARGIWHEGAFTYVVGHGFNNATARSEALMWVSGTPTCDPDTNCDGAVNGFDIEATEQAINGDYTNFCQASADLNGDGAENGFDIETEEQRVNGAPC
ncbi:hypothetical protein PHYC_03831 [Phycisphaerales bacterium]|nr:hypothetical protein PHYC_03831 [Phycisphaerales bacterium]